MLTNHLRTAAAILALLTFAHATEHGGSVYPVGVETVLTGLQPPPGETRIYEYTCFYTANQFANSQGANVAQNFHLRVFANAIKITHNWGVHFLGGTIESQVGVPFVYEQVRDSSATSSAFGLTNVNIIPVSVTYHRRAVHWYYEADMFTLGAGYSTTHKVNIGQHNLAIAPTAGVTYLPHAGKFEVGSRFMYIFNGYDGATHYHSGNEFTWEYNFNYEFSKKIAAGPNGFFYRQTTGDAQNGTIFQNGFRGRDLALGPQLRLPLGKRGALAVKYYRDTLVENKPRGNAFWFQFSVPLAHTGH